MNRTVEIITHEIKQRGPLSFARFMELALYCPDCGYYETEKDSVGRRGDFFTSVSVGSLFGELLAFQFAEWLALEAGGRRSAVIVEAGAHEGRLAKDILIWLQEQRPEIFDAMTYFIVEPSPRRRGWQKETLAEFAEKVRWVSTVGDLGDGVCGIIFSNELLDAMPVHRIGWDAKSKTWFEWGVAIKEGKFAWSQLPSPNLHLPILPSSLLDVLPDGFTTEISPVAESWWREAAQTLKRGKLLAIDYGLTAEEFFTPERSEGTLRAYFRHHATRDLLANPGEQDLTAHVNFTAIQNAGESAGLKTELFAEQAKFLTHVMEKVSKSPAGFGNWTSERARQFQTLTHPEHLGRAFRVLVQRRK